MSSDVAVLIQLLTAVRATLGLSPAGLAVRLQTHPRIIQALEAGRFGELPPWPETRRIVDMWVASAGIDPRPALANLAVIFERIAVPGEGDARQRGAGRANIRGAHTHSEKPERQDRFAVIVEAARRAAHPIRFRLNGLSVAPALPSSRPARWIALVVVLASLVTAAAQTRVVAGAISGLPAPAERAVRSVADFFAVRFAPVHNGHRWIEVKDPRSRRGDKLRIRRHLD